MTETAPSVSAPSESLGVSARASLLWGGGFTLLRDLAQFGAMLIIVRLLTPADYGIAALAQAVLGLAGMLSIVTFSAHTLQVRNPAEIDWQTHFTAAAALNAAVATATVAIAIGMSFTEKYHEAALPLAVSSLVFVVEVPGALRHRMLETAHDWRRFRLLLLISTLLALTTGLTVALMGGGVWALILQLPMLGIPAAIDLLFIQRFRPNWTWSWARWRDTLAFGLDRIGSGLGGRGRILVEQMLLSGLYDLATLGIFSRANGLATLMAGRIGSITTMSLHPVVTRADSGSPRFRRLADFVLRGVVWITLPAATFLGIAAHDIVALLYGSRWVAVAPLLPLAAFAVGLGGIITALSSLLVANNDSRTALSLDTLAALSGIAVALALIPYGPSAYLAGLSVHALVIAMVAVVILVRRKAVSSAGVAAAFLPAVAAAAAGTLAVASWRGLSDSEWLLLRLLADGSIFVAVDLLVLRIAFARPLAELLDVAPGGAWMQQRLKLVPQ